ncbi:MAG TPA: EVE domain-containing protein [Candidatus Thermoplasmatota archaeon]|nr:EVE domain-containing protein [Candidatus Thermoplasmatota archaeon]
MKHWLMKSEPESYSIDDLARDGTTDWTGVRNFKARNWMKEMQVGDKVLFYHSNADPPGAAGVAEVCAVAHADRTQYDARSDYFEPKATPEKPYWYCPDIRFVAKFTRFVPLQELRDSDALNGMLLTSGKASRLSVQPVDKKHFDAIVKMGSKVSPPT